PRRAGVGIFLALLLGIAPFETARAAEVAPEYQVKAAFLYNFIKFIEWPAGEDAARPIFVCILGKDPFGEALVNVVRGKTVNARTVDVRKINNVAAAASCQVLFVGSSEIVRTAEISKAVRAWGVLTVGEYPGFLEQGGVVNFLMDGNRVRFQIN